MAEQAIPYTVLVFWSLGFFRAAIQALFHIGLVMNFVLFLDFSGEMNKRKQ
jgi:hypothetical protein